MLRWRIRVGIHVLYSDISSKWLAVNTSHACIKHLYYTWCDGNHHWPAMTDLYRPNFLHKYKRMIKSKYGALNTLLNSAKYAVTRKEHFSFLVNILPGHSNSDVPISSLSSQISVCAPPKKVRRGLSISLSVSLPSVILYNQSSNRIDCHTSFTRSSKFYTIFPMNRLL
jgi:hypothetical protein